MEIEMTVRLTVPDATAITALHALERMGLSSVKKLRREEYYRFSAEGDFSKVSGSLSKADIIVNANKHRCSVKKPGEPFGDAFEGLKTVRVLVQDGDGRDESLLSTLRDRLGFDSVSGLSRGVLWTFGIKEKNEAGAQKAARKATEGLLSNKHFQQYFVMGGQ